jgi:aspartyl-tRNA(Asn)/glutamyl-tRNA(Gln) amidotransferase subunit A
VLQPLSKLTAERIEVVDVALPPRFAEVWPSHRTIMAIEAAQVHGDRFRRRPDDYPPRIAELIEDGLRLGEEILSRELARREELRREVVPAFARVHALLTPAATDPAPGRETTGDPYFNVPWSYFGWPTVSIPAGFGREHKMPVALQLIGQPAGELVVLAAAAMCEERIGWEAGLPSVPGDVFRET